MQVQSLVGELRSHVPCGMAKQNTELSSNALEGLELGMKGTRLKKGSSLDKTRAGG